MEFEFLIDGAVRKISLTEKNGFFEIKDGETALESEIRVVSENEILVLTGGRSDLVSIARDGGRKIVHVRGKVITLSEPSSESGRATEEEKTPGGGLEVRAPMPGKVIQIKVSEGEEVRKNQTLAIVEAMKMENEIKSGVEGIVRKIHAAVGELVDPQKPFIDLDAKTSS
jgi:biotin carboxyl carrier protein